MKVISLIEGSQIVKKIFKHLGLWDQKANPPPKMNSPPMTPEYHIDYTDSQLPVFDNLGFMLTRSIQMSTADDFLCLRALLLRGRWANLNRFSSTCKPKN
jgi:hypothetical protein